MEKLLINCRVSYMNNFDGKGEILVGHNQIKGMIYRRGVDLLI